ncbi:3-dehydroquinate synthase [Mucilaginibacter sp. UR6-11]|uniref:3-dehydroquinate synthase n=1 Tax=Mucilaginibacter sp. UR6-11 TaxID=1435644 RepID=UPI001E44EA88|nr:3-dehydroquinate synthase [Mucilaginibacter sp. UR6-11]MCC8424844.1 3-dehydroquinate synthase [Mucilaginibacter sp. UR6-11]
MEYLQQSFSVKFEYKVFFTTGLFDLTNTGFDAFLAADSTSASLKKILFVVDQDVLNANPALADKIRRYFAIHKAAQLIPEIILMPGGEVVKNDESHFSRLLDIINQYGIDRHSYVAAIGGGSLLDMAGYAAAVAHRGVKHIRIPTTVLSQNDSGVGVKNSINYFGKKNFLGTFVPPVAVFNDDQFLLTLTARDYRSGIAEAIKVSLIKDASFFEWLENNAAALVARDMDTMKYLIKRCAELHLNHIAGLDPFEKGSSRPLDFGHWSAHKLEQLTNFKVLHGEAVALGIALDTVYSNLSGRLSADETHRVINLIKKIGFEITHPLLEVSGEDSPILIGLQEFREHLGGELTIMLLTQIGVGIEVHEMDAGLVKKAGEILKNEYAALSAV